MKRDVILNRIIPLSILAVAIMIFYGCGKDYSYEKYKYGKDHGSWMFFEGDTSYTGKFDRGEYIQGDLINELQLIGHSDNNPIDSIRISIFTDTVRVGTYHSSDFSASFDFGNHQPFKFHSSQLQGDFSITITDFTPNNIIGTFGGTALDKDDNQILIENGNLVVNLK